MLYVPHREAERLTSEKAIVTGGAGFIGSHLADELAGRGYRIVIIDDLSTGKTANIAGLVEKGGAEFIEGSITDLPLLQKAFKDARYVFHQAALPSVPRSIEEPLLYHQVNATGTLNVLIAARDSGAGKVVCASSSAVYGNATGANREDMTPHPLSPYAAAKLAAEHYCRVFHEVYGLATVCLRYFNIYGPRQDPSSQYAAVIPRFIQSILKSEPPLIFGDGEQTRGFTFVRDAVAANILAAEGDADGIYNISQGESITVNRLAETITGIMGKDIQPVHREPRPGDIRHSRADISRAKTFGYQPKYDLKAGLKETIEWSHAEQSGPG